MIRVTIRNIGSKKVCRKNGVELPPPFHLLEIPPGKSEEVVCLLEQIEAQWPSGSGFKVADLLQQSVQRQLIRVEIQSFKMDDVRQPQIEMIQRKLNDGITGESEMAPKDSDIPDVFDPLYSAPTKKKTKKVAPMPEPEEVASGSGIDLPGTDFMPEPVKKKEDKHQDKFEGAIQMAFVGAGQGGGRIAQAFYDMGYSRVCAINTTEQDLSSLTIPSKLVVGHDRGGAGKDPDQGRLAAKESYEDIMDLLMRSWGDGVGQMFVCVGAGGGCIEENALIYTTSVGVERFGDLYDRWSERLVEEEHASGAVCLDTSGDELYAMSWDSLKNEVVPAKITRLWRHEVSLDDRVDILIEGGARVSTSAWHPTAVLKETGVEWIPAGSISAGDLTLNGALAPWPGGSKDVSLAAAWFAGAFFGNGGLYWDGSSDYAVTFKHSDLHVCQKFQQVADEEFGASARKVIRTPGAFSASCGTREAVERVRSFVGTGYGEKGQWKIPSWVWNADKSVAMSFLAGLLDTDGYAPDAFEVSYSTISEPAANGLASLFNLLLGGLARTTVRNPSDYISNRDRSNEKTTYEVAVRGKEVHELIATEVAPYMQYADRREAIIERSHREESGGGVELVRIPWNFFANTVKSMGFPLVTRGFKFGKADISAWMRGGYPTRDTFDNAIDELEFRARSVIEMPRSPRDFLAAIGEFGRNSILGRQALSRAVGCNPGSYDNYVNGSGSARISDLLDEEIATRSHIVADKAKKSLDTIRLWRAVKDGLAKVVGVQESCAVGRMLDCTVEGTENYLAGNGGLFVIHNSGTGSWPILVKAMAEYGASTNIEKPVEKHLGIIMTMPKRSEGARVQQNALTALTQACELVEAKKISTLIIVDNAKIHDLYPGISVKKFWGVANQNFAAVLHTFNLLAAKDSEFNTFDRADFKSVLRNGITIFGMTRVEEWEEKEDVSQAVRQNLAGSLLADGFDLSKADMAGAIVVAHNDVLEEIPMENLDYAFNSLSRVLGNDGITLHSGIYEWNKPGMMVFTIVSGLRPPQARLDELAGNS